MKKTGIIALICAVAIIICAFVGCSAKTGGETPEPAESDKISATIILVDKDEQEYKYDINVKPNQSLRDALFEAQLINEETYGAMFVETIDGHTADTINDGVTWLAQDTDGNNLQGELSVESATNFDTIVVHDGQTIKLVYYVVPMMD